MSAIRDDNHAILVALKIIEAQDRLLIAYRIGGRPPGAAIDTLTRHRPRLNAYLLATPAVDTNPEGENK